MFRIILSLLVLVLLTGCWDRREINDVAFVVGTALDWENGRYRTTIQMPLPGQLGGVGSEGGGGGTSGGKPWYIESSAANTVRLANRENQSRLSRELYFAHQRVILFGEELMKAGIGTTLDLYARLPQNRLNNVNILAAKGKAHDVLLVNTPIEKTSAEMVREMAIRTMKNPPDLLSVTDKLLTDGIDLALPAYHVKDMEVQSEQKQTIELFGIALFQEDKLVGYLMGDSAADLLWLMNQISNIPMSIKMEDNTHHGAVTLLFTETRTRIHPVVDGDEIRMNILVEGKGAVLEDDSDYSLVKKGDFRELERIASERLRDRLAQTIKKLQEEYRSDPLGFGLTLYRERPAAWHRLKERWRDAYAEVQVDIRTNLHLEHAGPLTYPFGIKERDLR
jgi:spore germination protein KC